MGPDAMILVFLKMEKYPSWNSSRKNYLGKNTIADFMFIHSFFKIAYNIDHFGGNRKYLYIRCFSRILIILKQGFLSIYPFNVPNSITSFEY